MKLDNEFVVPVGIDRTWEVLEDLQAIAPCLPGAQLESVDGDDYKGLVKVKLGPVTVAYRGTVAFVEKDRDRHVAVLKAAAREARGGGSANARITASLSEVATGGTRVQVETDLAITGRAAQFGGGVMGEVSAKMFDQFAQRLSAKIADTGAPVVDNVAQVAVAPPAPPQQAEVLELTSVLPWRRITVAAALVAMAALVVAVSLRVRVR